MTLTNDQIVMSLIAYYKRNGVDLTYLLGDPIFQSLRVAEKVEAVKRHASEMYAHSSDGLTRGEKTRIGLNSLWAAGAAIPATFALHKTIPSWGDKALHSRVANKAGLIAAAGGLLAGGLSAGFGIHDALANRRALRNELSYAARNPSTDNAVAVLAHSSIQRHSRGLKESLIDKATRLMDSFDVAKTAEGERQKLYNAYADIHHGKDTGPRYGSGQ